MNSGLIKKKFSKSIATYDDNALAQKQITEKLFALICEYLPGIPNSLFEIGCGTGLLTRKMVSLFPDVNYYLNDINDNVEQALPAIFAGKNHTFIKGDAQIIDYPKADLIISSSTIQWFNNLRLFVNKVGESLPDKGYLFISTFGKANLKEIRELTGSGLDYYTINELEGLFSEKFEILHISGEEISLKFTTPLQVLTHLRNTGVNAGSNGIFRSPGKFKLFCQAYKEKFSADNNVVLTYNPVYIALRKRN